MQKLRYVFIGVTTKLPKSGVLEGGREARWVEWRCKGFAKVRGMSWNERLRLFNNTKDDA